MKGARSAGLLPALVAALCFVSAARADGEAGLVVQEGAEVKTYCVAFQGDGISGDALLKAAGYTFAAFGGGSGLAVCSINDTGCKGAGSFNSCFCQCQGGDCTYWAFFTRQYGKNWVYSSLAFNLLKAKDGDVHGWKWGKGGANSAPAPADLTFEQVCGHAPRGGMQPTAAATPAPATEATATAPPGTAIPAPTPSAGEPSGPQSSPSANPAVPTMGPTVTITLGQTPPPATASPTPAAGKGDAGGSSRTGLFGFAAVAAGLVVATGGAAVWRGRRDR